VNIVDQRTDINLVTGMPNMLYYVTYISNMWHILSAT
jgi:hypothetical protein